MEYQVREIEGFYSAWEGAYADNNNLGEACMRYAFGDQWSSGTIQERDLRGEESMRFNMCGKHLLRVKGEAERLELSLQIKGNNLDPNLLKEGRFVLERLVLCNDHLSAFQKALNQVYDFGYSVMIVKTRQCSPDFPSEEPYLQVLKDPRKAFFDVACEDDFKTQGRFCGLRYQLPLDELTKKDKNQAKRTSSNVCDVIDFWYRDPYDETWYFTKSGKWTLMEEEGFLVKKKIRRHKVKFMRIVNGEVFEKPIEWYTKDRLPMVYWKGLETDLKMGALLEVKTMPFINNLIDIQTLVNYVGSAIVGRIKKLGGTKVIVTEQMSQGKELSWNEFNKRSGVMEVNESDDGGLQQPITIPPEQLDSNLLNAMQMSLQLMDQLAGINAAQQGQQQQVTTNAGLHRQIMQGNILQNLILSNHLRAINEVGRILKQMIPKVIIEQRDLGQGLVVNLRGKKHTPSSPEVRNDINELFTNIDFSIEFGTSSDAEKSANLQALKELITPIPSLAPYLSDELAGNLNTPNSDKLKRRMEALMPPGIQEVGEGLMSVEEYRQMQQQEAEKQQQQPTPEQQKIDIEKQKVAGDQQFKQAELQLKAAKMQQQGVKDAQNIKIKEAGVIAKMQPKEMVYEKGKEK